MKRDPEAKEFKAKVLKEFRALKQRLRRHGVKSGEGVVWVDGKPRSIDQGD